MKKLIVVLASAGLSIVAIGCGKASDTQAVGYVPGSVSFCQPGQNCTDLNSACVQNYGVLVGPKTCRFPVNPAAVGVLNSTDPSGPYTRNGMQVRQGDQVSFSGSGSWGPASSSGGSTLWGLISWNSYGCTPKYNLDGKSLSDGNIVMNLGFPEGLLGSDGTEVFLVGSALSNKVINHNGVFKIGLNASSSVTGLCGSMNNAFVDITTQ